MKVEHIAKLRKKIFRKWSNELKRKESECFVLQRQLDNTRKALWNGLQDPDGEWHYLICCAEAKIGKLREEIEKTKHYLSKE